jgi:TRAP-type uncharacterized transport system fused permease subunit
MDRAVVLLAKAAIPLVAVAGLIVGVLTLSGIAANLKCQ